MIQRIQTIFYLIAFLLIALPLIGMEIFSFSNEDLTYHFTLFGYTRELFAGKVMAFNMFQLPFFWGNLLLMILLIMALITYKSLRLQLRLGRFALSVYLVFMILVFVAIYFYSSLLVGLKVSMHIAPGLYMIIAGIPFVWLGNRGVNKDRKLLDSMDRLR